MSRYDVRDVTLRILALLAAVFLAPGLAIQVVQDGFWQTIPALALEAFLLWFIVKPRGSA